jgi:hypothetical protein
MPVCINVTCMTYTRLNVSQPVSPAVDDNSLTCTLSNSSVASYC